MGNMVREHQEAWVAMWMEQGGKEQERTRGRNKGRSREEGNNVDFYVHPVWNSNL